MIEVNFNEVKRHLYADGCTDLLRGVACLRWSLLAGESYEQAVRPWTTAIPELFIQRDRPSGHRTREHHSPRNERNSHVRQR
jgi:hypothetical protein